jgi:hypothetical protein
MLKNKQAAAERTYDRSFEHFARLHSAGKI